MGHGLTLIKSKARSAFGSLDARTLLLNRCPSVSHLWLIFFFCLIGCDRQEDNGTTGDGPSATASAMKVKLQLNWVPEPQFGGFYEAKRIGAYEKHGLDVEIVAGGAGTPTVQMIGAGGTAFGIVSADEIVVARSRGNDVVALFAVYQTCPQGIMTHASRGFMTIGDVFKNPGTLAMQRGLPYADFLLNQFAAAGAGPRIVPSPGGGISAFLADVNFSQQCFVTSEPILARQNGSDPMTFLVADAGYNPYTTVLATSGSYLKSNRDAAERMARAAREGWLSYLADPAAGNATMQSLNKTMDARTFEQAAAAQEMLISSAEVVQHGVGVMTKERWQTLIHQLVDLRVIDKSPPAEECFVTFDVRDEKQSR